VVGVGIGIGRRGRIGLLSDGWRSGVESWGKGGGVMLHFVIWFSQVTPDRVLCSNVSIPYHRNQSHMPSMQFIPSHTFILTTGYRYLATAPPHPA
jgi:hypothetical protein